MKKSGYLACYHINLIFFFSILAVIISGIVFFIMMITIHTPAGEIRRSDWPQSFAKNFKEQIIFVSGKPQVKQLGIEQLQENHIGLQILDDTGKEIYAFQKPENAEDEYSLTQLLSLSNMEYPEKDKMIVITQQMSHEGTSYIYIVHIPIKINKITMYLNGSFFTNGKTVFLYIMSILCIVIMLAGSLYGFWISKAISYLTVSIQDISKRKYLKVEKQGIFRDIYTSLNTLDAEIKENDRQRIKTETMRREWIANSTHDLKTPLSPIKGYAEMMQNDHIQEAEGIITSSLITELKNKLPEGKFQISEIVNEAQIAADARQKSMPFFLITFFSLTMSIFIIYSSYIVYCWSF